ncbi:EboA domain-containing protein [Streptomyces sp. NPDC006798]|uniref:EboA domain-containing protein n=1 Tax=Streptomyces sp. NPDC006798 TaxID=3155462 RepID=UPI0033EE77A8
MLTSRREPVAALEPAARDWFTAALAEARTAREAREARNDTAPAPATWESAFAAAGRQLGAPHTDAGRVHLLTEADADPDTLARLYHRGTAAERRAVLLALPHLRGLADHPGAALALVEDALRTNDTRLVAAAVGPYGAAHLDPHTWRHAVLKCLFTGVPLTAVDGLARRARGDTELARMLTDYAAERTAAARPVPPDLTAALTLTGTPHQEV